MPSIIWKGQLSFGLVSIPVKLYRAARRERVRLHYVHRQEAPEPASRPAALEEAAMTASPWGMRSPEPVAAPWREPERELAYEPEYEAEPEAQAPPPPPVTRVRQNLVTADDDQPVRRSELLRGFEVEPDRYVVLEPEELKGLQRKRSSTMEIVRSVRLAEVDPVFFETSYYVVPGHGGEKAYAVLFAALQASSHVALARVGMHGREHVVIVRPGRYGLLAHTMFFTDEIRFENEYRTEVQAVGQKELELARVFLEALEAPFAPEEFKDTYREELEAIIASKQASAAIGAPAPLPPAAAPGADILEALRRSIELRRKPVASETQPPPKPAESVAETRSKRTPRKSR